jgi:cytochrome P450
MHDAFSLVVDLAPGDAHPPAYLQAQQDAFMVIMEMIAERRARPRELDFISGMIASQEKHGINDDQELIANIFAVIGAGQGTTSTATGTMLMLLCQNPEQFDKVKADPSLIPQAVEEALRMHGAGFFTFPRFAKQDVEIGGVMIFKDMPVNISMLSANLDPTEYADPLRFDVMRNPKHIMSFGSGPHHCIGNRMARRIMAATLEQICQRFPNLHLQDPNFKPVYGGMYGELKPLHIPMRLS